MRVDVADGEEQENEKTREEIEEKERAPAVVSGRRSWR